MLYEPLLSHLALFQNHQSPQSVDFWIGLDQLIVVIQTPHRTVNQVEASGSLKSGLTKCLEGYVDLDGARTVSVSVYSFQRVHTCRRYLLVVTRSEQVI